MEKNTDPKWSGLGTDAMTEEVAAIRHIDIRAFEAKSLHAT